VGLVAAERTELRLRTWSRLLDPSATAAVAASTAAAAAVAAGVEVGSWKGASAVKQWRGGDVRSL